MRHRKLRRQLNVKSQHRRALLRNLVRGLVEHKRIRTTHARAKEASAFADSMVTIAKRGGLHARRLLVARLACENTAKVLMTQIVPHLKDIKGGYTRVLRLAPRPGDQSDMAILEFSVLVAEPEKPKEKKAPKTKKTAKKDAEAVVEKPAPAKVKETKEKAAKKETAEPKSEAEVKEDKKESEKKGGFLGSLRKFLKGD